MGRGDKGKGGMVGAVVQDFFSARDAMMLKPAFGPRHIGLPLAKLGKVATCNRDPEFVGEGR